jgi:hypothetical protein
MPTSCTTTGSGNWSTLTWTGCSSSPPGTTDVVELLSPTTITLDQNVSITQLYIYNGATLNGGSSTLSVNADFGIIVNNGGTFNGQTGTVRYSDANHTFCGNATFNNVILNTLTAPRTISVSAGTCSSTTTNVTVNGTFMSGSDATNKVTFVQGSVAGNLANSVTSYYCAGNGGLSNINCIAGGPPAVSASVESNVALAVTFLAIAAMAFWKHQKQQRT